MDEQSVVCGFSGKLRAMVATTKKKKPGKEAEPAAGALLSVELAGFPGGGEALELAARFCYGNGEPPPLLWRPTTFPLLYCAAVFLEMTEEVRPGNLLSQAEAFVHDDARRLWTWADAVAAVRSCERLVVSDSSTNAAAIADALLEKLVSALFSRIAAASRPANCSSSSSSSSPLSISSSSSSSPDTDSATKTPPPPELVTTTTKPCSSSGSGNEWWFDNVASLSPPTVEKATRFLGGEKNNKDPTITRFLLHYLRRRRRSVDSPTSDDLTLSVLANTAAHGVAALAATGGCFSSCRSLFRVLRTVSAAGASRESRNKLETLVGSLLDQATLDDLLVPVFVSGGGSVPGGGVYDVRLVVRLVRVFVMAMALEEEEEGTKRLRKVGRLVDKYLGEISPDQGLTVGRFLAVAESLPDSARGCFDGVYRALDIFLQVIKQFHACNYQDSVQYNFEKNLFRSNTYCLGNKLKLISQERKMLLLMMIGDMIAGIGDKGELNQDFDVQYSRILRKNLCSEAIEIDLSGKNLAMVKRIGDMITGIGD